jgi:hypothetical protein
MGGIPAFWRVTLTWPKPPEWGRLNDRGYIRYEQSSPEVFAETMGYQLQREPDATLEAAEMRGRTVRMVMKLPARGPYTKGTSYSCSAARAIDWALMVAQFGAALVGHRDIHAPLPEPVRVVVEPVRV